MTAVLERNLLAGGDGEHHPDRAPRDRLAAHGRDVGYRLTPTGRQTFDDLGLDLDDIERHRPAVRYFLDWSEQRHHLAGPLGTALTGRLYLDWIRHTSRRREVRLTDRGRTGLHEALGVPLNWDTWNRERADSGPDAERCVK